MHFSDERNILRIRPPTQPAEVEITPAMVESVRQRIKDAGGTLTRLGHTSRRPLRGQA
jgi:hypothetical protein